MRTIHTIRLVRNRQQRRAKNQFRFERSGLGLGAVASLLLISLLLIGSSLYVNLSADLPSLERLPILLNAKDGLLLQPTRLYDRSGLHVLYTFENTGIQRRFLSADLNQADHFSPQLIHAVISIVEPSFWSQPGFSLPALLHPQPQTLTERLVSDLLLSGEKPGPRRSLRMRFLSAQIIARYGHPTALEWYLNSAYFGHLAYGAEAAAQLYLGKSASQIDLAESALLLAALEAPALNPLDAPAAALERQKDILKIMLDRGALSEEQYRSLIQQPLSLTAPGHADESPLSSFSQMVVNQLSGKVDAQTLERGGLKIITTLNEDDQRQLICILRAQLSRLQGLQEPAILPDGTVCEGSRLLPTMPLLSENLPDRLTASAAILDPGSGEVLALTGEMDAAGLQTGIQGHAPGTMLTPFVAVAAFARGFSPASLVWDIPASLPDHFDANPNPDRQYHGPLRLRTALANDYLVPTTQLLTQIGPVNVWRFNEPLGMGRLAFSPDPAGQILNGDRLTLTELAQAYSIFANLGEQHGLETDPASSLQPVMVRSVSDANGSALFSPSAASTRVILSQPLAYLVHHVLADEAARRPSLGYPNPLEIGRPSGSKVGVTADGRSVWAIGYTPHKLVAVWMGLPDDAPEGARLSPRMAAGVWHAAIQYTLRGTTVESWQQPPGIVNLRVCDPSGQLPTRDCPLQVDEVFLDGNQPTAYDTLYQVLQVNRETGLLATVFTPPELVEDRTYLIYPPEALNWVTAANIAQPPTLYDSIQAPLPLPDAQITSPEQFAYANGKVNLIGTASGDGFAYYRLQFGQGLNPRTWQNIGSENATRVENDLLGIWDATGLEGTYALRLVIVRDDQRIDTATLQVTIDNTPPVLRLIYPQDGSSFKYPSEEQILFQAEVQENLGVREVQWFLDGNPVGSSYQTPYLLAFTARPGEHELTAKAIDLAGNPSEPSSVRFSLK